MNTIHHSFTYIQAEETVCTYSGDERTAEDMEKLYGSDVWGYALQYKIGHFIDSATNRCWAALINDSYRIPGKKNNLYWSVYHRNGTTTVSLKTTRAVALGEEFFVNYGEKYWNSGPHGTFTVHTS